MHAQELCDGDLAKAFSPTPGPLPLMLLHDGRISRTQLNTILLLAMDVASGMQHIHQQDVIHGDLNPQNVLLKVKPNALPLGCIAKIADFGLAVRLPAGTLCIQGIKHGTVSEGLLQGGLFRVQVGSVLLTMDSCSGRAELWGLVPTAYAYWVNGYLAGLSCGV